jgi:hypothetical protein
MVLYPRTFSNAILTEKSVKLKIPENLIKGHHTHSFIYGVFIGQR